jgi:hypothetical protein
MSNSRRAPKLEELAQRIAEEFNIPKDFQEASDHPGNCKCPICKDWWKLMGNDEDGYGPFTKEELAEE